MRRCSSHPTNTTWQVAMGTDMLARSCAHPCASEKASCRPAGLGASLCSCGALPWPTSSAPAGPQPATGLGTGFSFHFWFRPCWPHTPVTSPDTPPPNPAPTWPSVLLRLPCRAGFRAWDVDAMRQMELQSWSHCDPIPAASLLLGFGCLLGNLRPTL